MSKYRKEMIKENALLVTSLVICFFMFIVSFVLLDHICKSYRDVSNEYLNDNEELFQENKLYKTIWHF